VHADVVGTGEIGLAEEAAEPEGAEAAAEVDLALAVPERAAARRAGVDVEAMLELEARTQAAAEILAALEAQARSVVDELLGRRAVESRSIRPWC